MPSCICPVGIQLLGYEFDNDFFFNLMEHNLNNIRHVGRKTYQKYSTVEARWSRSPAWLEPLAEVEFARLKKMFSSIHTLLPKYA